MSEPSVEPTALPMLPYTYLAARLVIVVPTLLIIAFICGGFAGWGPGHELVNVSHKVLQWVDSVTELHWQ